MADLPKVGREVALTPQIQSLVSGSDIAAPFTSIAKGLGGIGAKLSDYQRMSEEGVLATEVEAAKTAAFKFQNEANGDVNAFNTSWDTYKASRLPAVPQSVQSRFEANLATIGGTGERTVLGDKFTRDQKVATDAVVSRQATLTAELSDLAQNGQSSTPEYEAKHSELIGLLNERINNPAFAYSKEHASQDIGTIEDSLTGAAVTGELQRVYSKDGFAAAQKRAQEIYDDPNSKLPVVARLKAIQKGLTSVRSLYEADSQARRDFSATVQQMKAAGADGSLSPDDPLWDSMISQADLLHDPVSKLALQSAQATATLNPTKAMSLHERLNFLGGGPNGAPSAVDTTGFVRGSANAAKAGPVWGTPGTADFEGQHLTTIKTPSGKSVTVNKVAAAAFTGFLGDLEKAGYKIDDVQGYNDRSKLAGGPSQHAYGNAIDINPDRNPAKGGQYGGAAVLQTDLPANVADIAAKWGITWGGDWHSLKDPMHFEFAGTPSGGGGTQVATSGGLAGYTRGVVPAVRETVKGGLDLALNDAETVLTKHALDDSQINDLVDAARIVDDAAYYDKVAKVVAQSDATAAISGTSAANHAALLDQMRAPGPTGDEAIRIKAYDAAQKTHDAIVTGLKDDPRGIGVELGLFKPGPAVDWTNLGNAGSILKSRASEMGRLENSEGQAPNSLTVLRPPEAAALKAAWQAGTAQQKQALVVALTSSLPPERALAVLAGLGKDGRSLAIAGALTAVNPAAGAAVIRGEEALKTNAKFGFADLSSGDNDKMNAAFPPDIVPPSPQYVQGWQDHIDAAKAAYADASVKAGDASGRFNEERWKNAVALVTGGVLDGPHGQKIIAPIPGMTQSQFDDLYNGVVGGGSNPGRLFGFPGFGSTRTPNAEVFKGAEWPDGSPLTPDQVRDIGVLHSSGDGRYVVELGENSGVIAQQRSQTDSATGRVITPFELDLKKIATQPQQPARVQDYVPPPPPRYNGLPPGIPLEKLQEATGPALSAAEAGKPLEEQLRVLDDSMAKGGITGKDAAQLKDYYRRLFTPGGEPSTGNAVQGAAEAPQGNVRMAASDGSGSPFPPGTRTSVTNPGAPSGSTDYPPLPGTDAAFQASKGSPIEQFLFGWNNPNSKEIKSTPGIREAFERTFDKSPDAKLTEADVKAAYRRAKAKGNDAVGMLDWLVQATSVVLRFAK